MHTGLAFSSLIAVAAMLAEAKAAREPVLPVVVPMKPPTVPTPPRPAPPLATIPRVTVDLVLIRDDDNVAVIRPPQAANDPASWATVADFPALAKQERLGAFVRTEASVDAAGKLLSCDPSVFGNQKKVGDKWVEDTSIDWKGLTCDLIRKRASFRPALGKDGINRPGKIRIYAQFDFVREGNTYPGGLSGAPPPPPAANRWPPPYPAYAVIVEAVPKLDKQVPGKQRKDFTGSTGVMMTIDDNGKMTACDVRAESLVAGMDALTCAGLASGKYAVPRPSIYREGRNDLPVLALWTEGKADVRFGTRKVVRPAYAASTLLVLEGALGDDYPAAARAAKAEGKAILEAAIDATGKLTQCIVSDSTGNDVLDIASCTRIEGVTGLFSPGSDIFGQFTGGRITGIRLEWKLPSP